MSDYNTVGIAGPCELGNPFFSYMKAMGDSVKPDSTAGGSHGIGKRAPLVCSKLRTHITSTRYLDQKTKKEHFLAQGYSLLISHIEHLANGKKRTIDNEGYWGDSDGLMPVSDPNLLPNWMQRKEIGTDIFLLGFDKSPNWQEKMITLILTNYFAAFARGALEVKLQDTEINKNTIKSLFEKVDHFEKIIDDKQEGENLRLSKHFYEVLDDANPDIKVESAELPYLGLVEMRILVREGLPQEYAVIRANMLIMTDLPNLKRFPNFKDFVAVIECKNKDGEAFLRSIEPSRHDSFEIDQLESEAEKKKARLAITKLSEFVRKSLRKYAQESTQQAGTIDFLSQFLSDDSSSEGASGELEKNINGKIIITPKKTSFTIKKAHSDSGEVDSGEEGGAASGENPGDGDGGGTGGKSDGDGRGGSGENKGESMQNLASAARVIETSSGRHLLNFSVPKAGSFKVSVRAVGLDSEEILEITESNTGKVSQGHVYVDSKNPDRISLSVLLSRASLGSYRLVCEEISK